eukprot:comp5894_c0_seq1/m.1752 comp5894_c0_seq1/g.1752  ORF comp5894_c0_seq1/g.1752 comp5894_c0_seq1/m.1752 type:complete len:183 (-) comp5894_c0_seq1:86-634(-)
MADAAWDDWETAEDAGVYDKVKVNTEEEAQKQKSLLSKFDPNAKVFVMKTEDQASQFVPQVKILKRQSPSSPGSSTAATVRNIVGAVTSSPSANAQKTLEQREQDYAKARARIFGENSNTTGGPKTMQEKEEAYAAARARIFADSQPAPKSSPRLSAKLPPNVIREPAGPDGTRGFKAKRKN